jgi:hypothetical protein
MSDNLQRAQSLQSKIKDILLKEWDPIGVQDIPEAQNEYDAYVARIYKLLISKRPEHEIFDYLWWVETEHMSLTGDQQRTRLIVKRLRRLQN